MKCERCGNPTKWVGSLMSGHLECEHCANDDEVAHIHFTDGSEYVVTPKESVTIVVVGAGGSGGSSAPTLDAGAGGSGGAVFQEPRCDYCGYGLSVCRCGINLKENIVIDNKLNPYAKCSHCGNSISNCSCRIQELTYRYLEELKGEFKC